MNRRTVLAGAGSIGLASLAGCLGLAGLDTHESTPAGVDAAVRADTGYEQTEIDDITIEEELSVGPYSETVTATNYLTEHEKAVELGALGNARAAVFMLLTTPQVSVVGQEFNPVREMSTAELIELVEDNYDGIDDISHEADEETTILGQDATMSRFTANAEFDGQDIDVNVHVTEAIETDDDLLVAIGVYPQQVQSQEEDNVHDLVAGIVEEADESDSTGGADGSDVAGTIDSADNVTEDDLDAVDGNVTEADLDAVEGNVTVDDLDAITSIQD